MPTFLGRVTEPLEGSNSPVRIFMKRRFAGAVRPGDGIAPSGQKGAGDIFKQDSGAEAHGNIVD